MAPRLIIDDGGATGWALVVGHARRSQLLVDIRREGRGPARDRIGARLPYGDQVAQTW